MHLYIFVYKDPIITEKSYDYKCVKYELEIFSSDYMT